MDFIYGPLIDKVREFSSNTVYYGLLISLQVHSADIVDYGFDVCQAQLLFP